MAKLKEFLQTDKFVLKSVVQQLLIQNTPEREQKGKTLDLKKYLLKDREKWIKVVKGLGVEYLQYLAKNGLNYYILYNNSIK